MQTADCNDTENPSNSDVMNFVFWESYKTSEQQKNHVLNSSSHLLFYPEFLIKLHLPYVLRYYIPPSYTVKVINTTLIFKFVSTLAKLQQHENSSNGTHQSTRSVKLHTRMRIGYMLISRDISLYELFFLKNNETDVLTYRNKLNNYNTCVKLSMSLMNQMLINKSNVKSSVLSKADWFPHDSTARDFDFCSRRLSKCSMRTLQIRVWLCN